MHFKRRVRQVSEFPFWFVILAGVCSTLVLSRYRGAGAPSSSQLGAWQQFNSVHKLKYAHSDSQCKVARGQPTPASVAAAGRIGIRADSIASRIHTLPFVHSSKVDIVPNGNYRGCLIKKKSWCKRNTFKNVTDGRIKIISENRFALEVK